VILAAKIKGFGLVRTFSAYFISTILNQAVNFLLLPLFTKHLSTTEYGILSVTNTTLSVITILVMTGADGAVRREFYKKEGKEYASFFSSSLVTVLVSFVIVTGACWLLSGYFQRVYQLPAFWLILLPVIALMNVLYTVLLGQYRVQQQAVQFAIFSNLHTLMNLGLAVWLVAGQKAGYEGRLYSIFWTNMAFFAVAAFVLIRKKILTRDVKKKYSIASWKYGLPLIPHQLGGLVVAFSDRYFLASKLGLDETGIYNIGYTIGSIIGVIEGTIGLAFVPFLFENLKENSPTSLKRIVKTTYLFVGFLLAAVLGLWAVSGFVFEYFIDPKYWAGQQYVLPIALGYFFSGCYKLASGYIFYTGKTMNLTMLAFLNVATGLTFNYFFIKWWGAMGAAFATMSCFFIMFMMTAYISNKLLPMPWLKFHKERNDKSNYL
jgi:O-antigen/teichoic acid export membrane protein